MRKIGIFLILISGIALMCQSCATNKKKKCNTCPKWTSEIVQEPTSFIG